jgi:lipid-A-disaccharide synthase
MAANQRVQVVDDSAVILQAADLALTAMGTATLETAVTDCLPIAAYRGNAWMWLQLRALGVGTDLYAMPNIMLGERIVPELVQNQATAEGLGREALNLWESPARQAEMHASLARVRAMLGSPGASRRVAGMALRMARGEKFSPTEDFSGSVREAGARS